MKAFNLFLLLSTTGIFILTVVLFYFHSNVLCKNLLECLKPHFFKRQVNKDLVAYNQQWKCAACRSIMLSSFRITTLDNIDYAICMTCSPQYSCIDNV